MKKKLSVFLFVNLLLNINNLFAQANHANNISGSSTSLTEPLGWLSATGSSNDLDIINQWNSKNINFHTMIGTNFSRKMQLLNTGEFGIGTTPFTPAFKLDVDGDVNINDIYSGFKIGPGLSLSRYVLWYNGNESNIFVGTLAGLNCVTNYNSFVGHDAGANTGVSGKYSGDKNSSGSGNSFYGYLGYFSYISFSNENTL